MANFNFYFTCCLLLASWRWRASSAVPVRALDAERQAQCASLFRGLLLNVTELLRDDVLCFGTPSDKVALGREADTVLACAPTQAQSSGCLMRRNSSFSESECLGNITKDLALYEGIFQSYLKARISRHEEAAALLTPTLGIIKSLRKNCSLKESEASESSEEDAAQTWGDDPFSNRYEMCKMMRGFHVRAITINRALGYISSGEHRE